MIERQFPQRRLRRRHLPGEGALHPVERRKVGALKGIDRLFLVADDEKRARRPVARPRTGRHLLGQPRDHAPLLGGGVLRLVDEDVVDPAVEAIEHPLRHGRGLDQPRRPLDEIVEVEPAAPRLVLGQMPEEGAREGMKRDAAPGTAQRDAQPARLGHPAHQIGERGKEVGPPLAQRPRRQAAHLGREGLLRARPGQQHIFERAKLGHPGRVHPAEDGAKRRGRLAVVGRPLGHRRDRRAQHRRLIAAKRRRKHARLGQVGGDAQMAQRRGQIEPLGKAAAMARDLMRDCAEVLRGQIHRQRIHERRLGPRGHRLDDLGPQEVHRPVIGLGKEG